MKHALVLALGLCCAAVSYAQVSTGSTTGVSGSGFSFNGVAVNSFGNHTVTLNVSPAGNSLGVTKGGPGTGNSITSMSAGLSICSVLGQGTGSTGGTVGTLLGF